MSPATPTSPGRHKKPSAKKGRLLAGSAIAGALVIAPLAAATPASAGTAVWDRVAKCESGQNWHINTGNGYYGGLQFSGSTWRAYGGGKYASTANHATRMEQITIARKVLSAAGPRSWPVCSQRAGLTRSNGKASAGEKATKVVHKKKSTPKAKKVVHKKAKNAGGDGKLDYRVVRGDTLAKIAHKKHVSGGWKSVWKKNKSRVSNPNNIYVGQRLDVK
jgi:hypothetical protein